MTALLPDTLFRSVADALGRDLSSTLDVNPRRVRAWAAGEEPVPEGVWRELYELLRQQAAENDRLSYAIMAMLYPGRHR